MDKEKGREKRGVEVLTWRKGLMKSAGELYSSRERASPRPGKACVACCEARKLPVKPGQVLTLLCFDN